MATQLNDKQRALARFGVAVAALAERNNDPLYGVSPELANAALLAPHYEDLAFSEAEATELINLLARESVVCGPWLGDGETEADSELNEALSSLDAVDGSLKQAGFRVGHSRSDVPGADLPAPPKDEGQ